MLTQLSCASKDVSRVIGGIQKLGCTLARIYLMNQQRRAQLLDGHRLQNSRVDIDQFYRSMTNIGQKREEQIRCIPWTADSNSRKVVQRILEPASDGPETQQFTLGLGQGRAVPKHIDDRTEHFP